MCVCVCLCAGNYISNEVYDSDLLSNDVFVSSIGFELMFVCRRLHIE